MGERTAQGQWAPRTAWECFLEILAEIKKHPFWIRRTLKNAPQGDSTQIQHEKLGCTAPPSYPLSYQHIDSEPATHQTQTVLGSMWHPGESQYMLGAQSSRSCYLSGCIFCPCHSLSDAISTGSGAWVPADCHLGRCWRSASFLLTPCQWDHRCFS